MLLMIVYDEMLRRALYGKLPVRQSLRYCGIIGGNTSKLISWLISLGFCSHCRLHHHESTP